MRRARMMRVAVLDGPFGRTVPNFLESGPSRLRWAEGQGNRPRGGSCGLRTHTFTMRVPSVGSPPSLAAINRDRQSLDRNCGYQRGNQHPTHANGDRERARKE
jgi:hypothetical protein